MTIESNKAEVQGLKNLIDTFIVEQIRKKTPKNKSNDSELEKENSVHTWISKAALRASQRQLVTHAVKYHHPDALGCGIYLDASDYQDLSFVSTLSLTKQKRQVDFVGNAAAMDVQKFLLLSYNNESILLRILRRDKNLFYALPGSFEDKNKWCEAFEKIVQPPRKHSTHTLAKQIYFPIENSYYVLCPLFPSTLVQEVYEKVQESKFGETNKQARIAKKANKHCEIPLRQFPNLAIQKFGGSKPQNISYLNTKRTGKAYLFPSLPPQWKSSEVKLPYHTDSIFNKKHFPYQVRKLVRSLSEFLSKSSYNNLAIRQKREDLVVEICDKFIQYAAKIISQESGWSADPNCVLAQSQMFWLDPGRALLDKNWSEQRDKTDWISEISDEFANWFNREIQTKIIKFGDEEYNIWKKLIKNELLMLKELL